MTYSGLLTEKDAWHEANVAGRRIKKRKGSGKGGKRKSKAKKRGRFRPHGSKAHTSTEENQSWEYQGQADYDTLYGKGKGLHKSGKRKWGKGDKSKDGSPDAFKGWFKGSGKFKSRKGKKAKSHIAQSGNEGENATT